MDHNKHVCSTLQKRSCGTEAKIIGSIVVTFPNLTSGMYSAQTTCAQPVNTYTKLLEGNLNTYNCTFVCRHNNVLIMHQGQSEYKGFHVERYIILVLQSLIAWKKKTHSASHNLSYVNHIMQAQIWKSFWAENLTSLRYLPIPLSTETKKQRTCNFQLLQVCLVVLSPSSEYSLRKPITAPAD